MYTSRIALILRMVIGTLNPSYMINRSFSSRSTYCRLMTKLRFLMRKSALWIRSANFDRGLITFMRPLTVRTRVYLFCTSSTITACGFMEMNSRRLRESSVPSLQGGHRLTQTHIGIKLLKQVEHESEEKHSRQHNQKPYDRDFQIEGSAELRLKRKSQ